MNTYLIFHTLAELFSIVVAWCILIVAWNSRRFLQHSFFLFLGVAYASVGAMDLVHTLAFKGMGVFAGSTPNLPTQLWIAARYVNAGSLLLAPLFLTRQVPLGWIVLPYVAVTVGLLAAVFTGRFPDCFREGAEGLTAFKVGSEYLVCTMIAGAMWLLWLRREHLDKTVVRLLLASMAATIATELAFTLYMDVYGFFNMLGHLLKITAFALLYQGIVVSGLRRPYDALFRDLRLSEERYRQLVEMASEGIWQIDERRRTTYVNARMAEMLGCEPGEIMGRHIGEFVAPEEMADVEERVAGLKRGQVKTNERRLLRRDGSALWVQISATPLRDKQGNIVGSFGLFTDISERKRGEEELKALHEDLERRVELRTEELAAANRALEREVSERRKAEEAQRALAESFRDLYNNAPCGYHSLNADGVFVRINDTELKWLGYKRDEVIGRLRFSDLLTPESKGTFRDNFLSFKERGEVRDLEFKMLRKDGTALPALLSATAVRDGEGGFLMSWSTVFDMTERKKAEAEVIRAAKLATLGELAASVAHEINNPLNSIINYAQIVRDEGHGRYKGYDLAGEILEEGNRLAGIVRNMLSYARESSPDKSALSVEDVINNSTALCAAALQHERIELRVHIEKELPLVTGNLQQLEQVLLNLISNARHALKERHRGPDSARKLEIRAEEATERGGSLVRISVWDNGGGIPASLLERVAEPFFTTKPSGVGTGLGLSISKKIMEDHHGRLAVESAEGQYTRMSIELPAATEFSPGKEADEPEGAGDRRRERREGDFRHVPVAEG